MSSGNAGRQKNIMPTANHPDAIATLHKRALFLNLAVADLDASMAFFASLGFAFDPRFTNDQAACMIVRDSAAFVMLLQRPFFSTFTQRAICDTSSAIEGVFAFSAESRQAVDSLVEHAVRGGGKEAREPYDYGYMYGRSFFDLDGHQWEVLWMDAPAAVQAIEVARCQPARTGSVS